jgi:hypothetical protein
MAFKRMKEMLQLIKTKIEDWHAKLLWTEEGGFYKKLLVISVFH